MDVSKSELYELNEMINRNVCLEQKSISSLVINKGYLIKKMFVLDTRYGKAILAHLFDDGENKTFKSFLPKRVTDHLKIDLINKMNSSDAKYTLTYMGQSIPNSCGKAGSLIKFDIVQS